MLFMVSGDASLLLDPLVISAAAAAAGEVNFQLFFFGYRVFVPFVPNTVDGSSFLLSLYFLLLFSSILLSFLLLLMATHVSSQEPQPAVCTPSVGLSHQRLRRVVFQ